MGWGEQWVGENNGLGRTMGWGEQWVGENNGLGRTMGWGEQWVGENNGLGRTMGWGEQWVGENNGLGRTMGWGEQWVGEKNGLGRRMGWGEEYHVYEIHRDYNETSEDMNVSYEFYRKEVTDQLDISFCRLGEEGMREVRVSWKYGNTGQGDVTPKECEECASFAEHKTAAEEARRLYKIDVKEMNHETKIIYFLSTYKKW